MFITLFIAKQKPDVDGGRKPRIYGACAKGVLTNALLMRCDKLTPTFQISA